MSQSSLFTSCLKLKGTKEPRPRVFSGIAATFQSELHSFCSDVDVDNLRNFMLLAVHAEIVIVDDGKGLDAGKLRVLGRIGEMCLKKEAHVQIKKEPLSSLFKASVFSDEHDDEEEPQSITRFVPMFPELEEQRVKLGEFVRERLGMGDDVDAIPVEDRVCRRSEYEEAARRIYYRLSFKPAATIKITMMKFKNMQGIDFLHAIIVKLGMKTRDRTKLHLDILQTNYNSARRLYEIKSPLEWLEQQLSARVNLEEAGTSFNDDLILQYLYDSFQESPAGEYIKQSMNTDGVDLDQFLQGMYDRSTGLDLDKDKTVATLPGVPANAAKPHSDGICQWCGTFGHGASQCGTLLKLIENSDRKRPHHRLGEKLSALKCTHCKKQGHSEDRCWVLHPELAPTDPRDPTRKRDETREEKTEEPTNGVKAAAAKTVSGEGVEPTYTMTDMIEFAARWQEERDTTHAPILIKGRAAKIKFHD